MEGLGSARLVASGIKKVLDAFATRMDVTP